MQVDDLLLQLRHPLAEQRRAAAALLDDIEQSPEIELALREAALRDPDKQVRRNALHSLSCHHCKPDGCLGPAVVDVLVHALLHDSSIRNRRWAAGVTMFGQAGRAAALVDAYRAVLETSDDRVLRERAQIFLAAA
jgi:HEAT repeat protein